MYNNRISVQTNSRFRCFGMGCTWEKFSPLPAKKKNKNLKPRLERKTLRQKWRVTVVGDNYYQYLDIK